jgi:hypothetical protein
MWIIFGTNAHTTRVPGGVKIERRCEQCQETATFYEKEIKRTFSLYYIDVFDYERHRVMACGCCGACYATDELGIRETPSRDGTERGSIGNRIDQAADRVGGYVERAAGAVGSGISSLFSDERPARPASSRPPEAQPPGLDEDLDDLVDPIEARFRELEKKAGLRNR